MYNTANGSNTDSQARMMRGMEMLQNGAMVKENADGSFTVPSQTSAKTYEVRVLGERMVCTCPDFEHRQIEACKHIHLVKFTISIRHLRNEPKPKVFASDAVPCDRCGSIRVIHYGMSGRKQAYLCKDCKRKFTQKSMLDRVRFSPELVSLTLDLYFSGLSVRKVARNVNDHFDLKIDSSTIYRWIQKYVPLISAYVNTLSPELSDQWHADELFVKMKGGSFIKKMHGLGVIWNIMDRQTRFLIASKLTESRDVNSAIKAFEEAVKNAHGQQPQKVYTDSLRAYIQGIEQNVPNAEHVRSCGVNLPHRNNNRIERMNGTLRERTKVQRGLKTVKTPIAEGQRIQYNFVKPHQALNGKTPAQAAGIYVQGWKGLLERANLSIVDEAK